MLNLCAEKMLNVKVIGVGGAGKNIVNRMMAEEVGGIDFVVVSTDRRELNDTNCPTKVLIGEELTGGVGTGSNFDIGKKCAEASTDAIAKILEGADLVFITAGMGGGTGTGAAPVIAELAREAGILTIGVVTKPFSFEGKPRMKQAEAGVADLEAKVDALITVPGNCLKDIIDQKINFANGFAIADDFLKQILTAIPDGIKDDPNMLINLDLADVSAIMRNSGRASVGFGVATGEERAAKAAKMALSGPLMKNCIDSATGAILIISGSCEMSLNEIDTITQHVMDATKPDANIIFGASMSAELGDEIRVTLLAADFDEKSKKKPRTGEFYSALSSEKLNDASDAFSPKPEFDINDIDAILDLFKG